MAGVTTLGDGSIWVWSAIGVDSLGAVVLLVGLAVVAGQVCTDLGTDTDTISDPCNVISILDSVNTSFVGSLDGLDVLADLDGAANDFVTNAERKGDLAPAASDGVDIGSADTTGVNGNVNVAVLKRLELELGFVSKWASREVIKAWMTNFLLLEFSPFLGVLDNLRSMSSCGV